MLFLGYDRRQNCQCDFNKFRYGEGLGCSSIWIPKLANQAAD